MRALLTRERFKGSMDGIGTSQVQRAGGVQGNSTKGKDVFVPRETRRTAGFSRDLNYIAGAKEHHFATHDYSCRTVLSTVNSGDDCAWV